MSPFASQISLADPDGKDLAGIEEEEEEEEEEPEGLVDESEATGGGAVRAFGASAAGQVEHKEQFQRQLNLTGQGATRCRVFHSKVALNSLEFMENQINEWIDSDQIEIKHVGHLIGTLQGKTPEPNLIVMVWY